MGKIERFENLECWKQTRELVRAAYLLSSKGKLQYDYDLRSQFRRAAVSSMNNIAEGFCRYSSKEFVRFLDISSGSIGEVKSMLYLMEDLDYASESELTKLHNLVDNSRRLTLGLIKYLSERNANRNTKTREH